MTSSPPFEPLEVTPDVLVVDTSAILNALAKEEFDLKLAARLWAAEELHAPHHIDVEMLHALSGLVRGGKLSADRARDARRDFEVLPIERYPIVGLADRVWELRGHISAYDACYIALAEALKCPLVTSDGRLKRAGGHNATVEFYAA